MSEVNVMDEKNTKKYKCPCCGNYTFPEEVGNTFEVCEICNWEDDLVQLRNPDFKGGANKMSLNEARQAYKEGREIF